MTFNKNISPSRILTFAIALASVITLSEQEYIEQNVYKSECYNPVSGKAKKCMPEFTNAGK
jgi:hypothetical protein